MEKIENIKIEDLKIGDEILTTCNSRFKYLRLLKNPVLGDKNYWGRQYYKSVSCSTRRDLVQGYNGHNYLEWIFSPEDHNKKLSVNLNYTAIVYADKHNFKEITIDEVEEGQNILISCQNFFKWVTVLKKPVKDIHGNWKMTKCSTRKEADGTYSLTDVDHNTKQYIDLHYRQLLLIEQ